MINTNKRVKEVVSRVDRRQLRNNTQKVLLSLLNPTSKDGWVARTALRVPSASARVRDLRKAEFGGFQVECISASELGRRTASTVTSKQTFYRLVPNTVTVSAVQRALKGVI